MAALKILARNEIVLPSTSRPPTTTRPQTTTWNFIVKGRNGLMRLLSSNEMLPPPDFRETHVDMCACSTIQRDTFPYITALSCLLLGLFFLTYGYRSLKTTMFAAGFCFAASLVYILCLQEPQLPLYGNICLTVCAGILFGLITQLTEYIGIFLSGFESGVFLGISGMTVVDYVTVNAVPTTYWKPVLIILMSGIVTACTNLYFRKALTIISTSICGGALIVMSLDYLVHRWATVKWVFERVKLEPSAVPPCPYSWLILAAWPICVFFGIIIQCFLTGTGIHHEKSLAVQKRRSKAAPVHLTCEQRAEMRQRKYRYLYQVRTAHGDVISQSYVQALQAKNSNSEPWQMGGSVGAAGECSTLQSDSTRLTVLASDMPHPDSDDDIHQIRSCR